MRKLVKTPDYSIEGLRRIAQQLSRQIIHITTAAGSGHPSSSLSAIDLLTYLYFGGILKYDPQNADWPERDRFILSKGHAAPALYVVLARAGFFSSDLLYSLRQINSPLEGHPNMRKLPGVEASTGSLGQGLSIGLGHALAAQLDKRNYRVYVLLGDGEIDEGQIWEAAMAAAKYRVGNLTAILDYNGFQQTGAVAEVMPTLEPLAAKWTAFGWQVTQVDGHNLVEIGQALQELSSTHTQPQLLIAHTRKGRGLSPFEQSTTNRKHGEVLTVPEVAIALAELDKEVTRSNNGAHSRSHRPQRQKVSV